MNTNLSRINALVNGLWIAKQTSKINPEDSEASAKVAHFRNLLLHQKDFLDKYYEDCSENEVPKIRDAIAKIEVALDSI